MNGLDAYFQNLDRRYQLQIDEQEALNEAVEKIEIEAEAEFKQLAEACNMSAPVVSKFMPIYKHIDGKYTKVGMRPLEFGEWLYDCLENKDRANRLLRALLLCAKKGNIEAVEAVAEIEALYVKNKVDAEMESEE